MTNLSFVKIFVSSCFLMFACAQSASAEKKAAKKEVKPLEKTKWAPLLKQIDKNESQGKDMKAQMRIILVNKAGEKRMREAIFFQRSVDRRLIQFKKPASEAGITVLIKGADVHLYIPRLHRTRRIAAHVKNQPFMGSDLSFDDMGSTLYSASHTIEAGHVVGTLYRLTITPKKKASYHKLQLFIDKKDKLLERVDYLDSKGTCYKRVRRTLFKRTKGYAIPARTIYQDMKTQHKTIVLLRKVQMDTGISKRMFTRRYLKRELEL